VAPLCVLLVLLCRLLRPIVLIRFGWLRGSRIGHLVFESDLYLCERRARLHPRRSLDLFYFESPPCNRQVAAMLRRRLFVSPLVRRLDRMNRAIPGGDAHAAPIFGRDTFCTPRDTHDLIANSPPNLVLTKTEQERCGRQLEQLGIPADAEIVCLHNRDSAYLRHQFPHMHWDYHAYRDFPVDDFQPAIEELLRRGCYVVRVGQDVEQRLVCSSPRVVDYASSPHRSDLLDVYLCWRCRFFVGNSSGLFLLATAFRRPVVSVNNVPLESTAICARGDLVLPKPLWSEEKGRLLSFAEVVACGAASFYLGEQYAAAGLRAINNDPEDIRAAVAEMDDRLRGQFTDTPRDLELAQQFKRVFESGSLVGTLRSRLAATFLRRHAYLLRAATSDARAA
jgi:putative glycosyltransferase (TIGR04372 family)